MVRQFAKLGIQLDIRATDFNQFQEKVLKGKHQIYWWGWFADYPDAENFLFLLYGPNSKSLHEGENTANYANPEFDGLYRKLQSLEDGPEKAAVMARLNDIVREDAPWAWGYWPFTGQAFQHWVYNGKPSIVIRDPVRYYRLDPARRVQLQDEWNRPVWWPLLVLAAGGLWLLARVRGDGAPLGTRAGRWRWPLTLAATATPRRPRCSARNHRTPSRYGIDWPRSCPARHQGRERPDEWSRKPGTHPAEGRRGSVLRQPRHFGDAFCRCTGSG